MAATLLAAPPLLPIRAAAYGRAGIGANAWRASGGRLDQAAVNDDRRPERDGSRGTSDAGMLLRACAAGDRSALRRLYEEQSPRLYALALRVTRHGALASDVLHDAFLSVWRNAAQFDPARGSGEAWLTTIVRNRALDLARRQSREVTGVEIPEPIDESEDALTARMRGEESLALRRCLETLDVDRRSLIVLAFIDGQTHADLAARTGIALGTVKSHIRRGLQALRRCLDA